MYVLPFCKIIVYILFMGNNKLYFFIEELSLENVFTIENLRPIRDGMTVSRDSKLGTSNMATFFQWAKILLSARKVMTE